MKVSKGQSQPEIVADIRLLSSLLGSGSTMLIAWGLGGREGEGEEALMKPLLSPY